MLILCFALIVVLTAADQFLKLWAIHALEPIGVIPLLRIGGTDIIRLRFLENAGAAFGNFAGKRWLLIGFCAVMTAACVVWLLKWYHRSRLFAVSCSMVIAGAVGNLIDRIFRGGLVVDYIDVKCINFPVFNFADCCVVIGTILLGIYILFGDRMKHSEKQEKAHD